MIVNLTQTAKRPCYCEGHDGSRCFVVNEAGLICTRREGHAGPHVACGIEKHCLAEWQGGDKA